MLDLVAGTTRRCTSRRTASAIGAFCEILKLCWLNLTASISCRHTAVSILREWVVQNLFYPCLESFVCRAKVFGEKRSQGISSSLSEMADAAIMYSVVRQSGTGRHPRYVRKRRSDTRPGWSSSGRPTYTYGVSDASISCENGVHKGQREKAEDVHILMQTFSCDLDNLI